MDRLFLDANILVAAAWKADARLGDLWGLPDARLLGSPHVIEEARRNTHPGESAERLERLIGALTVLPSEPADFPITNDPGLPAKDRPVLLAAIAARADYLITGDLAHFGPLFGRSFDGVTVMLPGEYLRSRAR
ncbi:MAG: PIN domain-containing protein [Coriobacteriia bacterium]|nr:PIN domain-containing protein [Coriobacteriia bacterium]